MTDPSWWSKLASLASLLLPLMDKSPGKACHIEKSKENYLFNFHNCIIRPGTFLKTIKRSIFDCTLCLRMNAGNAPVLNSYAVCFLLRYKENEKLPELVKEKLHCLSTILGLLASPAARRWGAQMNLFIWPMCCCRKHFCFLRQILMNMLWVFVNIYF